MRRTLSLLCVLLASAQANAQRRTLDAEIERSAQLIVMLSADYRGSPEFGAGIIVGRRSDRLFIATASHVLRREGQVPDRIWVSFRSLPGKRFEGQLVKSGQDEAIDVAVIAVDSMRARGIDPCMLPFDRLGAIDSLARGDDVLPVGNPNGVAWAFPVTPDRVAHVSGADIVFQSAFISRGHSGGALLDGSAGILGMTVADQPPYGRAIRIDTLLQRVSRWGVPVRLLAPLRDGLSELHVAARENNPGLVRDLLRDCSNANTTDRRNATPLHFAAYYADTAVLNLLLAAGASTASLDVDGDEPLEWAASSNHVENARLLIRVGAKISHASRSGRTPLHAAVRDGHPAMVRFLIGAGADVNAADKSGNRPLDLAKSLEVMRLLVSGGAKANARSVWQKGPEETTLLLRAVIDVNAVAEQNDPLVVAAARAGRMDLLKRFLEAGANVNGRGTWDATARHWALARNDTVMEDFLIARGGIVWKESHRLELEELLISAVSRRSTGVVKRLLAAGIDPNTMGGRSLVYTNLQSAIENEDTETVRVLVKAGADVNDGSGTSILPLKQAMNKKLEAIVQILRAAGAKEEK